MLCINGDAGKEQTKHVAVLIMPTVLLLLPLP